MTVVHRISPLFNQDSVACKYIVEIFFPLPTQFPPFWKKGFYEDSKVGYVGKGAPNLEVFLGEFSVKWTHVKIHQKLCSTTNTEILGLKRKNSFIGRSMYIIKTLSSILVIKRTTQRTVCY